jgi:hypothetical protein
LGARGFVKDLFGIDLGKTLDEKVYEFLGSRKILPVEKPDNLAKRKQDEVELLGATFYFARKFFTTSHDIGEGVNPTPLVEIVFDVLKSSDNTHAAKFLEELSSVSSKEPYTQERVVAVVRDILPVLSVEYSRALRVIEARHPIGTTLYNTEKIQTDEKQRSLLDKVVPYIKEITRTHQTPTVDGFRKYAGSLSDFIKPRKEITETYLLDTIANAKKSAKKGEDLYLIAVKKVDTEAGPLVGVQYQSHAGRPTAEIKIYIGNEGTPQHASLILNKSGTNRDLYTILLGICDHVLATVPKSSPYWGITLDAKEMLQKWVKPR